MPGDMQPHFQHCMDLVREESRADYAALLFLPKAARPYAFAVQAFHLEIDRISFLVSDPMPGEIRLQWWRDVLSRERENEGQANPVARALLETIAQFNLPVDGFDRYLEARIFDLYQDPMPDRTTLEAYLGETESFILQMKATVCGIENSSRLADPCGHGGVALGIGQLLSRIPQDRNFQRVYLPADLLSAAGLTSQEWLSGEGENHLLAVDGFRALGNEHLGLARTALSQLPKSQHAVFLPLAGLQKRFSRTNKAEKILQDGITVSQLRAQWSLLKASIFGI